jgi:uncharacterized protein YyaL (SSP411 family)
LQQNQDKKPNRLINEKTPYLLQHAYNPVDWFSWGPEALDKAKAEDKPVFLSIGYASCHWCHVMEAECFSDQEVANLLNQAFVCVKVDREERPDLDAQYMAVCQAMGRNCGWPLNILMTPKLNPFYAASYIPKYSRAGLIGMLDLVPQVMQIWRGQRAQLEMVGADIKSRIETMEKRTPQKQLGKEVLQDAYDRLTLEFDDKNGGFGTAPKFPRPHNLLFLLRTYARTGEKNALFMVEKTLTQMRLGGIYDQIGFGFHRYSTDAEWLVPHFEKMLYDQALMAIVYTEAFQATGAKRYGLVAKEIINYALRDLASPQRGFYSAQDADTEGEEGKFYLWTMDEVLDTLNPADADLAVHIYGLKQQGNFPDGSGKNILHIAESLEELAPYKGLTLEELIARVHNIRDALFEARKKRLPPATDDKILTDWNGLMIAALAKAGTFLNEPKYLETAMKTADFILDRIREDGVLYHRYAKGERAVEGFLDDYAFFVYGLIELHEASFEDKYLQAATDLTKIMVTKFWDDKNGGFYQTQKNGDAAMPRMKQLYDGAIPSGNSVALHNLLWLSRLTNEPTYDTMAAQMTKTFAQEIEGAPEAFTFFLSTLGFLIGPSYSVTVVGDLKEKDTSDMLNAIRKHYLPSTVITLKHPSKAGLGYQQIEGKATAYVCQNQTCLPPTNSAVVMLDQLQLKDHN